MKIEATAAEIRVLLELAESDTEAARPGGGARSTERLSLARRVPRRLLEAYELLLEVGRVPAVVPIEAGACTGCHVRLPTMLESAARRSAALHKCPHCRRLMYAPALLVTAAPAREPKASAHRQAPGKR